MVAPPLAPFTPFEKLRKRVFKAPKEEENIKHQENAIPENFERDTAAEESNVDDERRENRSRPPHHELSSNIIKYLQFTHECTRGQGQERREGE